MSSSHFIVTLDVNQDLIEEVKKVTLGYRAILPKAPQILIGVVMEQGNGAQPVPLAYCVIFEDGGNPGKLRVKDTAMLL